MAMNRKAQSENGKAAAAPREVPGMVRGRQSNHGNWHLPTQVAELADTALWLAVACWGLARVTPFNRDDIATAFRISPRRAADVMTYILASCDSLVRVDKSIVRVASGHRQAFYQVQEVNQNALDGVRRSPEKTCGGPRTLPPRHKEGECSESLRELKRAFLMRRTAPE